MAAQRALSSRLLATSAPRAVAAGVWLVQGQPGRLNVYLIEDGSGVTMFDAGGRSMAGPLHRAAESLGGLRRIVLGHAHTDHRGAAPALGVEVLCHADEVPDAEGSGGFRYWPRKLAGLPPAQRYSHRLLHTLWDAGPVTVAQTIGEGDTVAGFEVVHLPGHAPGLIALWRASDKVALVSDAFYTIDMWARHCPPVLPVKTYNYNTAQARESLRKLAALEPAAAWSGHGRGVIGEVRRQLENAAETA